MANPDMVQALETRGEIISLRPAPDIVDLSDIPGEEAARVRDFGWQRAFFNGSIDPDTQSFSARLTLSKPLVALRPEPGMHLLPEEVRERIDSNMDTLVAGSRSDDGSSRLAAMLALINQRGGDADLVICTAGTGPEDYWREHPAMSRDNFRIEQPAAVIPNSQIIAIRGLYEAMADASDALLSNHLYGLNGSA
jgi:hypothetical protein